MESNKNSVDVARIKAIKELRERTGCGMAMCGRAYDYAKGDEKISIAYVRAKGLAVATPGLTFDERVQRFIEK